jgi:glycosyltransferase involved in cell wall biosynthesis
MKTSLAHHWLTGMRGGERVLEELVRFYPEAPIYSLLHRKKKLSPLLAGKSLYQSWFGHLPAADRFYRQALPFHPAAIRSLSIPTGTKLLISSDASLMKGIPVPEGCTHLCYCHSPPRYLWEMPETYLQSSSHNSWLTRAGFSLFQKSLKQFDFDSAQKVNHFIANSQFTRDRIQRFYQREAEVIYPPVDTDFFQPDPKITRNDHFLIVSSLVPYKKVGLAIKACNQLALPLTIIGDGPERPFLEKLAGSTIRFLGRQSDEVIRSHYQQCRALIFPTLEDFGMVPVEAQACGCPVLAFGQGGALESVVPNQTGLFFNEQNPESLINLMSQVLPKNPEDCRTSALRFSKAVFKEKFLSFVSSCVNMQCLRPSD